MSPPPFPFARRRALLREAEAAYAGGRYEEALAILTGDDLRPRLGAGRPRELWERILEGLAGRLLENAERGEDDSVVRILNLIAAESPAHAEQCRSGLRERWDRPSRTSGAVHAARDGEPSAPERDGRPPVEIEPRAPKLLRLTVDEAGDFLLVAGEPITIGHAREEAVDLPFLADVLAHHATLRTYEDLRSGSGWQLVPEPGAFANLDGRDLNGEPARLEDGATVELARNLGFRVHMPDTASASALLRFLRGAEARGAGQAILLAPGPGGRVRIGSATSCLVRPSRIETSIELFWSGERLLLRSAEGLIAEGRSPRAEIEIPLPPPVRMAVRSAMGTVSGRPPFGLTLAPERGRGAAGGLE